MASAAPSPSDEIPVASRVVLPYERPVPRGSWRIRASQEGPPGHRAAMAAGFIVMLLSIVELLVAAPAHAWIVSSGHQDCYCELGSYTGVAFGCAAALWFFGPGAFLLFLRERRRRDSLN